MIRLALVVLLAACTGADDTDDTDPVEDADDDGYTEDEGDCDDDDPAIHPGATEVWYDGVDQDCSGGSDHDQDGDGVDVGTTSNRDCDDTDPDVYPGATEVWYNGVDENCDGESDYDQDGDGYDASTHGGFDCDDTDPLVNPGADELCSTAWDDDCNDGANENDAVDATTWYPDADEDGYGSPEDAQTACLQPEGFVAVGTDCNDDPEPGVGDTIYPGAPLVACDGYDNDCDPLTFEASAVLVNDVAAVDPLGTVIANAVAADVITVCEGKHVVNAATISQSITLRGMGAGLTLLEAPQIDIDPGTPVVMHGAPLLRVGTVAPVTIEDLTLTKGGGFPTGDDWYGGGLYVAAGADVHLDGVHVVGNGSGFGSGIYVGEDAELSLLRVTIADNIGDDDAVFVYPIGGGLYLDDGSTLSMHESTIDGNEANIGGGIAAKQGVAITATGKSIVSNNDGGLTGGGIDLEDGSTVSGLTISGNVAVNGAGVHANETIVLAEGITLSDVIITENSATNVGGGLTAIGFVALERVQLVDNATTFHGGNLYATGDDTTVVMTDGAVRNGSIGSLGRGGGVYLNDATLQVTNVDFGTGDTENEREDVWLEASVSGSGGKQGFFGTSATFILDDELGACYPEIGETCL